MSHFGFCDLMCNRFWTRALARTFHIQALQFRPEKRTSIPAGPPATDASCQWSVFHRPNVCEQQNSTQKLQKYRSSEMHFDSRDLQEKLDLTGAFCKKTGSCIQKYKHKKNFCNPAVPTHHEGIYHRISYDETLAASVPPYVKQVAVPPYLGTAKGRVGGASSALRVAAKSRFLIRAYLVADLAMSALLSTVSGQCHGPVLAAARGHK